VAWFSQLGRVGGGKGLQREHVHEAAMLAFVPFSFSGTRDAAAAAD